MNRLPDGVVLAAGYSSRMSRFKPLCPIGPEILLDRVIRIMREGGLERIYAVTGFGAERLTGRLRNLDVTPLHNGDFDEGMYSSVTRAVRGMPDDSPGFLMLPVDYPFVLPGTIKTLVRIFIESRADVIHPVCGERRGHPPVIRSTLYRRVLDYSGVRGLGGLFREEGISHNYAETGDEGILFDADTDEALEELLAKFGDRVM